MTWDAYFELVRTLIRKLRESGIEFQQVICIAKGGMLPGELIARTLGLPLAVLSVSSYPDGDQKQREVMLSRDLTSAKPLRRAGVILVDDLTDSGLTTERTLQWLADWESIPRDEITLAVLWHKQTSTVEPDVHAQFVATDASGECPWIDQPQETFRDTV